MVLLAAVIVPAGSAAAAPDCGPVVDGAHQVGTPAQLTQVGGGGSGTGVCGLGASYRQTVPIDLTGHATWEPIGTSVSPFTGTYDGGGNAITGLALVVADATAQHYGLFGRVSGGEIRNLRLQGVDVDVTRLAGGEPVPQVGALAGAISGGQVSDIHVSGRVALVAQMSDASVGGVLGGSGAGQLTDVAFTGEVSGTSANHVGGVVGRAVSTGGQLGAERLSFEGQVSSDAPSFRAVGGMFGTVSDTGAVIGPLTVDADLATTGGGNAVLGGVAGSASTTIEGARAEMRVDRDATIAHSLSAGGIAGFGDNATVRDSHAAVQMDLLVTQGTSRIGGLVGEANMNVTVQRSSSAGEVRVDRTASLSNPQVGGLIGGAQMNVAVIDSFSTATTVGAGKSNVYVGGLIGMAGNHSTITRSFVAGVQSATAADGESLAFGGALFGGASGPGVVKTASASFWDADLSSNASSGRFPVEEWTVSGLPTSQMQQLETFRAADWDIEAGWDVTATVVWGICEDLSYPFLNSLVVSSPCDPLPDPDIDPDPGEVPSAPASPTPPPAPPPSPDPVLPVLPPDEGGSQVGGQPVDVTVEGQPGGVRLVGDGFEVEVRTPEPVGRFSARRGRGLMVLGSGFALGSTVTVVLRSETVVLGEAIVDQDGSFELDGAQIPAQVPACPHTLHVIGTLLDGQPAVVSYGIWVRVEQAAFGDIDDDGVHALTIGCLADTGIINGVGDGRFDPWGTLTRGQAASLIARGGGLVPAGSAPFPDVVGSPHGGAIAAASEAGIILGFDDGSFRPGMAVSRGQYATMLAGLLELDAVDPPFDDAGDTHGGAIGALHVAGIVTGFPDGRFRPDRPITRAQAATMLHNAIRQLP